MKAEQYLLNSLKNCTKVDLRPADQEFMVTQGTEEFIFNCLMSKKFVSGK